MDKEKFKLKLEFTSGDLITDQYIQSLHEHILSFDTSNIKKVILALDNVMGDISDDLNLISSGDTWIPDVITYDNEGKEASKICGYSKLKVLSDESSSKTFDRVMVLMTKVDNFKSVSELADSLKPEIEETQKEAEELKIDRTSNVFEQLQEQHYKKNKSK